MLTDHKYKCKDNPNIVRQYSCAYCNRRFEFRYEHTNHEKSCYLRPASSSYNSYNYGSSSYLSSYPYRSTYARSTYQSSYSSKEFKPSYKDPEFALQNAYGEQACYFNSVV